MYTYARDREVSDRDRKMSDRDREMYSRLETVICRARDRKM